MASVSLCYRPVVSKKRRENRNTMGKVKGYGGPSFHVFPPRRIFLLGMVATRWRRKCHVALVRRGSRGAQITRTESRSGVVLVLLA